MNPQKQAGAHADQSREIASEQTQLDVIYTRLDQVRAELRTRLDATLRADAGGTALGMSERDAMVAMYRERLASLAGADDRLCFGRLDLRDSSRLYIGRIGLADEDLEPMLIDWRAPVAGAFYQATAQAPGELVRRRHLTTRDRMVLAVEDDVLDLDALDDAERGHLVGEGALLAAVQAARTGRMGDIIATIQAEQDRLHKTSGGVSDTELKELAVRPTGWPSAVSAVTMVTPVANMPSAARNSCEEKLGGWALRGGFKRLFA